MTIVMKFGGASVASIESFLKIAEIASDTAVKAELCVGSDLDDIFP